MPVSAMSTRTLRWAASARTPPAIWPKYGSVTSCSSSATVCDVERASTCAPTFGAYRNRRAASRTRSLN